MRFIRLAIVAAAVLGLGAGGVYAYNRWLTEDDTTSDRPLVTAVVERKTVRQTVVTRGTIGYASAGSLLAAKQGRVTGVHVATGTELVPGTEVVSIDGRAAVAIPGSFPFWRDLRSGDTGADVEQLEAALAAEGFDPGPVDTSFTWDTRLAVEAWQQAHGSPVDGTFRTTDAFVGPWPARVGQVRVNVGDFVTPGMALVTTTTRQLEVTVQLAPTQRLRVREGQEVIVELTATRATARGTLGVPTEAPATPAGGGPAAAAQADQGPSYIAKVKLNAELQAVDGAQVAATVLLAEAPNALVVPIGAVVQDGQGKAAVQVQEPNGTFRLVNITTGLAEGALVEVKSGLQGGETVLLEKRR